MSFGYNAPGVSSCECGHSGECYDASDRMESEMFSDADDIHTLLVRITTDLDSGDVNPKDVTRVRELMSHMDRQLATYCEEIPTDE